MKVNVEKMKVNIDKEVNFCGWCGEVSINSPLRCDHYEQHNSVYIKDCEIDVYKCEQCGTLSSHYRKIKLPLPRWVRFDIFEYLGIQKFIEDELSFHDHLTNLYFSGFSSGLVLRCPNCKAEL